MIGYSLQELLPMLCAAIALDWLIGDPRRPVHPVIRIGQLASVLERRLYPPEGAPPAMLRRRGAVLTSVTVLASGGAAWGLVWAADAIHPWLGYAVTTWLIATTIAVNGLRQAAMQVYRPLVAGRLDEARTYTGYIVGRDTGGLDAAGAARATVETVAENTVDAFVAPIVLALLGGAPLAMLYRAANTLDSMVGYRNARYLHFGWASARLDDVLNYVPARLCGVLLALAALPQRGLSATRALRAVRVFAARHPSPNSGIPESAVAGALGIELGGLNVYFGRPSERARLGWPLRALEADDILRAIRLLYGVSIVMFAAFAAAAGGVIRWGW
ncbi:cobalamin biosynthesis protein CobD [Paenibacillus sp. IB182496]|uniref:Cobalamin biosynthesis protein CobD n=1 Tax=Paenibacillus sabuli TaxID=2772509 RepID=A0A927BVR0_9BACL|nr:adenosylcobinamide-phosphate synthase CbiB [Paenibacillus sabuli]MBD2846786.1 cobalamin biosynthesis protein CobD [Paenibacillus sabuli]